jgi:hypothetical protein
MVARIMPSRDLVRQLLDYDADTGVFTWRPRPREMFPSLRICNAWNSRCAGKVAGTVRKDGYSMLVFEGVQYLAHRVAWLHAYGEPIPVEIDHADFDPGNNRLSNLRAATRPQNRANSPAPVSNTTGFKGVSLDRRRKRFYAQIKADGLHFYLGTFDTAEEAAEAYRDAAVRLHGKFARWD